jgi:glycosyltransferase involved in cell wall biosynthesis
MKKLLIFTTWQDGDEIDLSPESNLWYVRRYETYFDEITHVLLCGHFSREYKQGNSRYVSVGSGKQKLDLILAPFRIFNFARKYKPSAYLTVEQVWLFWIAILVKIFLRAKIALLPITYPEAMYKLTGRSLTGVLPIRLERWFSRLSYWTADRVITCRNSGSYANWMEENPIIRKKLLVTDTLPEAIPTVAFFEELEKAQQEKRASANGAFNLIYVGRLHPEKSVEDIIRMMEILRERCVETRLTIIGDGSDRQRLENLAADLALDDRIDFLGWKSNAELPHFLARADAFVSPSAGGSLREAALCGLPIVAYELDWIKGFLEDGKTFLSVKPNDYEDFAQAISRLRNQPQLKQRLANNIQKLGWDQWSDLNIDGSVAQIYDSLI